MHKCPTCERTFKNQQGLSNHVRSCRGSSQQTDEPVPSTTQEAPPMEQQAAPSLQQGAEPVATPSKRKGKKGKSVSSFKLFKNYKTSWMLLVCCLLLFCIASRKRFTCVQFAICWAQTNKPLGTITKRKAIVMYCVMAGTAFFVQKLFQHGQPPTNMYKKR